MLANQLAKAITDCATTVVPVAISGLRQLLGVWTRIGLTSEGTDLLDRADADAVGLAEGAIDCPGLGHAHLGAADERGDVRRVGVAIADEAFARFRSVDRGLKCPALCRRLAEGLNRLNLDASTPISAGQACESGVGNVPSAV